MKIKIKELTIQAMTPLVGPVADGLVQRGWTVTSVRKLAQALPQHENLWGMEIEWKLLIMISGLLVYFFERKF